MKTSLRTLWQVAALALLCGCAKPPAWEPCDLPKTIDPDGDCKLEVRNGQVDISVPGTIHDLGAELGRMNSPRALCEVEGDFSVRVEVACRPAPRTPTIPQRKPYHGASLVIMQDEATYIRLDRAAYFGDGKTVEYANFELRKNGQFDSGTPTEPIASDGFVADSALMRFLRLDRQGDRVSAYISDDGVHWSYLSRKSVKLSDKVYAGVSVTNTAKEPFSAKFSQFGVARLKRP